MKINELTLHKLSKSLWVMFDLHTAISLKVFHGAGCSSTSTENYDSLTFYRKLERHQRVAKCEEGAF